MVIYYLPYSLRMFISLYLVYVLTDLSFTDSLREHVCVCVCVCARALVRLLVHASPSPPFSPPPAITDSWEPVIGLLDRPVIDLWISDKGPYQAKASGK